VAHLFFKGKGFFLECLHQEDKRAKMFQNIRNHKLSNILSYFRGLESALKYHLVFTGLRPSGLYRARRLNLFSLYYVQWQFSRMVVILKASKFNSLVTVYLHCI